MKWLKFAVAMFFLTSSVGFAGSVGFSATLPGISINTRDIVRVDIGPDEDEVPRQGIDQVGYLTENNRNLRRRVRRLEQALRQMQDQIYRLEDSNARPMVVAAEPQREFTCYIKTTFKGTVFGKGSSEMEAKAKALKSCDDVGGGFSCEDGNAKCGS